MGQKNPKDVIKGGGNVEPLDCIPGKFTKRYSTTRNIQVKLFNFKDKEFFKH